MCLAFNPAVIRFSGHTVWSRRENFPGRHRFPTITINKSSAAFKYNLAATTPAKNIEDPIEYIRTLLKTTGDGRISVSPYDTAWVALIKDLQGRDAPQFPSSLEWIVENQLEDGSWGDEKFFCVYDRLVCTIACVVALRSWNVHDDKVKKGVRCIKENVDKLREGNEEHMTCGFEVVFPALLQKAKELGIEDLPYDAPAIQEIYQNRERKLKRIPLEMMHKVPTSLLFSLEGLKFFDLEWDKLLKLQSAEISLEGR